MQNYAIHIATAKWMAESDSDWNAIKRNIRFLDRESGSIVPLELEGNAIHILGHQNLTFQYFLQQCHRVQSAQVSRTHAQSAVAMVIPAPNSNNMPQGIFSAVSQSMRRIGVPSAVFSPLGITNSAITAKNATMASLV